MSNEKIIWDILMQSINNPIGVAAIMGNIRAESTLNPLCITGKGAKEWDKQKYADAVDNGEMDISTFAHDGIAFGIVQWRYYSRKELLYKYVKTTGESISSLETQVRYLIREMYTYYKSVWKAVTAAEDMSEATDTVMLKYEKPGTTTEAAKQKRREFAMKYYEKYATEEPKEEEPKEDIPKRKYVVTTAPKVVYRCGNATGYGAIGRILAEGSRYPWVATAKNGWHAIEISDRVAWVSGDYSKIIEV